MAQGGGQESLVNLDSQPSDDVQDGSDQSNSNDPPQLGSSEVTAFFTQAPGTETQFLVEIDNRQKVFLVKKDGGDVSSFSYETAYEIK